MTLFLSAVERENRNWTITYPLPCTFAEEIEAYGEASRSIVKQAMSTSIREVEFQRDGRMMGAAPYR